MKSYTNTKLRKKLQNKGIILDEKKKQHFDKYSYYQVINAYKNIFSTSIENIDDIENNIKNSIDIDRYRKNFSISNDTSNSTLYRGILISICQKYGINLKYTDSNDELKEKIKGIKTVLSDLNRTDFAENIEDCFKYGHIVFASSTYNMEIFPPMRNLLLNLKSKNYQTEL